MKKIVYWSLFYQVITIFLLLSYCFGAKVSLEWDPNIPTPEGYRVFVREVPNGFNYSEIAWEGTNINCTISDLKAGKTYCFVVRAFDGKSMSGDSNYVFHQTPEIRPKNIRLNDKTLSWDAVLPAPEGYKIYIRAIPAPFDFNVAAWEGPELSHELEVENNIQYGFVVRAFTGDELSSVSAEIVCTFEPDPEPVVISGRPKKLIIIFEEK